MNFIAIAAMSENRVIGAHHQIPWYLPEDLEWFKQQTTGKVLLMGRKTFESMGRPLPRRRTIVLSRIVSALPGVEVMRSMDEVLYKTYGVADLWICGGAEIYALTLSRWNQVFLTRVKQIVDGDAFFPEFEHLFPPPTMGLDTPEFSILHYRR